MRNTGRQRQVGNLPHGTRDYKLPLRTMKYNSPDGPSADSGLFPPWEFAWQNAGVARASCPSSWPPWPCHAKVLIGIGGRSTWGNLPIMPMLAVLAAQAARPFVILIAVRHDRAAAQRP